MLRHIHKYSVTVYISIWCSLFGGCSYVFINYFFMASGHPRFWPVTTLGIYRVAPQSSSGKLTTWQIGNQTGTPRDYFVQSWTEHKVTITRMNMIKVLTATTIMIAMMGWQGMTWTWLWCLWFWMLMDVENVLLRRIQGLIASSLKSCWSLEPHFGCDLHLPVAESYTCKWNLLLCFGWCGTVVMLILTKWFWNWSE